jgi:hypothetical protein
MKRWEAVYAWTSFYGVWFWDGDGELDGVTRDKLAEQNTFNGQMSVAFGERIRLVGSETGNFISSGVSFVFARRMRIGEGLDLVVLCWHGPHSFELQTVFRLYVKFSLEDMSSTYVFCSRGVEPSAFCVTCICTRRYISTSTQVFDIDTALETESTGWPRRLGNAVKKTQ